MRPAATLSNTLLASDAVVTGVTVRLNIPFKAFKQVCGDLASPTGGVVKQDDFFIGSSATPNPYVGLALGCFIRLFKKLNPRLFAPFLGLPATRTAEAAQIHS